MRQQFSRDQTLNRYCHNGSLEHSLDDHATPQRLHTAALQADLFEYLCLEGQEHRRNVELNALQPMVGSDPLTHPQLTRMQEARQQHHDQAAAAQRQADMLRQVSQDMSMYSMYTVTHTVNRLQYSRLPAQANLWAIAMCTHS